MKVVWASMDDINLNECQPRSVVCVVHAAKSACWCEDVGNV